VSLVARFVLFVYLTAWTIPEALEAQSTAELKIGGGTLDLEFDQMPSPALRTLVLDWTTKAAHAVTAYYGQYPVHHVTIHLDLGDGSGVGSGRAAGYDGAQINVAIGRDTTRDDISEDGNDWLMTHEMVHLALPSVEREHHWIEEGLATYVEPVARVRVGELTAARVWGDMVHQMPLGQPQPGDQGLDRTPTWGRTYWGGAIFCLLADVKIRQATHNRAGLETALRGILRAGGSLEQDWPLTKVLDAGDHAIGVAVLRPLYEQMKFDSRPVDLNGLWQQLGVKDQDGTVVFDDSAPLAAIRKAIMAP
jgi:hypothetical protein